MTRRRAFSFTALIVLVAVAVTAGGYGVKNAVSAALTGKIAKASASPVSVAANTSESLDTRIEPTDSTPNEYTDAIDAGKPVVILFYVRAGIEDNLVLKAIEDLQPEFSNYVFLLYEHNQPAEYGDLSTLLQIDYPPEVILVDGTGTVRQIWNGYVDKGSLNQGLVNLGAGSENELTTAHGDKVSPGFTVAAF